MSWKLTEAAWRMSGLPSTAKFVLVRLCGFAKDDGSDVFPSVRRVAADCGLSERGCRDQFRFLEREGLLCLVDSGDPRTHRPRTYRIVVGAVEAGGKNQEEGASPLGNEKPHTGARNAPGLGNDTPHPAHNTDQDLGHEMPRAGGADAPPRGKAALHPGAGTAPKSLTEYKKKGALAGLKEQEVAGLTANLDKRRPGWRDVDWLPMDATHQHGEDPAWARRLSGWLRNRYWNHGMWGEPPDSPKTTVPIAFLYALVTGAIR